MADRPDPDVFDELADCPAYRREFQPAEGRYSYQEQDPWAWVPAEGTWSKVYHDGWLENEKWSLHYFESNEGAVCRVKLVRGWSVNE